MRTIEIRTLPAAAFFYCEADPRMQACLARQSALVEGFLNDVEALK
jgi:hypothetical protein